jgi:hypothetical protein
MQTRILRFLAGPELGAVTTLSFAGLYTWPLLTSDKPSTTFYFAFCVWCAHVAFLAAASFASKKLAAQERGSGSDAAPLF